MKKLANRGHSRSAAKNDWPILGKVSFYGLLILIALTAIPYGTVDPWLNHLVVVFVCVCGLLRILDGIIVRDHSFGEMWMLSPLIAILFFAFIQSLPVWSLNSMIDLTQFSASSLSLSPVESRNFVLRFAGYLVTAEILFHYVTRKKRLEMVLLTFLIIALGSLVFAFIRNFLISGDLPRLPAGVGFGQFINQNHFAFLMEMLLGVLVGLLIKADISRGLKLLSGVSIGLTVVALILSNSRGAVLSMVGSGIVAIALVIVLPAFSGHSSPSARRVPASSGIFLRKIVLTAVLIVSFITLAAFTVAFVGGDRLVSRIETIPGETQGAQVGRRIDFWQATGDLIKEYPVLGVGFGAYTAAITKYEKSSGRYSLQQAHNDYLDLAANGGIISVLLAASFFILLGKAFLRQLEHSEGSRRLQYTEGFRAALCVGAAIGISEVFLHSLVEFGLRTSVNAFVFILLIVMAAAAVDESSKNLPKWSESGTGSSKPVKIASQRFPVIMQFIYLLFLIVIGAFNLKVGLSFYFSDIAALTRFEPAAVRAISFDPSNYQAYETSGQIRFLSGQYSDSIESFKKAVDLDPNNYLLRLNLVTAYLAADRTEEAIENCRVAINLAPSYAGPQLAMGLIYFKEKKFEEAFAYFNKAADLDLELLPLILYNAQKTFFEDSQIDRMVAPSTRAGRSFAANYFLDTRIRSQKMEAFLTGGDLPDDEKENFVRKLIALKNFPLAFKVWNSQTANKTVSASHDPQDLLNGGFENEIALNETGFGWQIQRKRSGEIRVSPTEEISFAGRRSLKIDFNGNTDPAEPVISQTVLVEPRSNYQLTFVVNSNELVTGGPPLITVYDGNSGNPLSQSSVIGSTGGKWRVRTLDLQIGQTTQAVVINFQRKGCSAPACPIFGSIFLDEFILKRVGNKK